MEAAGGAGHQEVRVRPGPGVSAAGAGLWGAAAAGRRGRERRPRGNRGNDRREGRAEQRGLPLVLHAGTVSVNTSQFITIICRKESWTVIVWLTHFILELLNLPSPTLIVC